MCQDVLEAVDALERVAEGTILVIVKAMWLACSGGPPPFAVPGFDVLLSWLTKSALPLSRSSAGVDGKGQRTAADNQSSVRWHTCMCGLAFAKVDLVLSAIEPCLPVIIVNICHLGSQSIATRQEITQNGRALPSL